MKCFACLEDIPEYFGEGATGASLTSEGGEPQVCRECWEKIPVAARVVIMLAARDTDGGGIGLADMLFAITDLALSPDSTNRQFPPGLN